MEHSLIILKPDAIQRGLIGAIITRLEQRGLHIIGLKMMHIDDGLAKRHYAVHDGKPFFASLVSYITSSPVVVVVVAGNNVIQIVRNTVGATNPTQAAMGTIRGDYGLEIGRNLIHASDSPENGEQEVRLFFTNEELCSWHRTVDTWIYES
jgi:nucleoside-diphosphate kinase